jgi:gliding motility-associated-like protein
MKKFLSIIIALVLCVSLNGQTISGKGGAISDNGTEILYPITVSGIAPTSETFGLAAVSLDIDHSWTSDLNIYLIAPDGFRFKISLANGGSGQNYKNTVFTTEATTKIEDADAPFTGTFIPQDNLNYLNKTKNTNGVWKLAITDTYIGNSGTLNNWSLRFGTIAPFSMASAPSCTSGGVRASESCDSSPLPPIVCNLNGYCGDTSSAYAPPHVWPGLTSAFCGGIQNNSFIRFIAGLPSVTFNVWVYNSSTGGGVQYMVFGGNCGSGPVTSYGCNYQLAPTSGGASGVPDTITASGLTVGNVYYLMFDGYGGDVCNYIVGATPTSGIVTLNLTPSQTAFCLPGDPITVNASGLTSPDYTWTSTNPSFVPPVGTTTSSITVTQPGTYTVNTTTGCGSASVTLNNYVPLYNTVTPPDRTSYTTFDLTSNNAHILNGQAASNFSFKYYKNQTDALNVASNFITNPTSYTISPPAAMSEVIWASVTDNRPSGGGCAKAFSYTIYRLLPLTATNSGPICAGSTFDLYCNPAPGYSFVWTDNLGNVVGNTQNVLGLPAPTGTPPFTYTVTAVGFPPLLPSTTTLTVNSYITPTFAPVAAVCEGSVIAPLPLVSLDGYSGTWSPALNNMATTTYTFTPTPVAGLCLNPTTLVITITPKVVPSFAPISAICAGGVLPALPNLSINGYVGLWAPGLNNLATTTYTFTPTPGQCAAPTTMTIVVNPNPVATVTATAGACQNATTLPFVTFTGTVGTGLFTFTYNINGGTNQTVTTATGNNSLTVNVPTGVLGTFNYNLVKVQDAYCTKLQTATATVKIVSPPTLFATNVNYTLCDDDFSGNDGVANFFLHTQDGFFQNPLLYTVNYYETLIDAQLDVAAINLTAAAPYRNLLFPGTHTLYVRVVDSVANACPTFGTLTLIVKPLPMPPLLIPDFVKCDDNLPKNGTEVFNLHDWDANCGMVTGTTTATYYAQDPSITVGNPPLAFLYTNLVASPITTIWVKLTDNITGCWNKRSFRLIVNPLPTVAKPIPAYTKCDYDNPGDFIEVFNLSTQLPNINTTPGIVVTFHYSLAAATAVGGAQLPNLYTINALPGNTGVQTIFVRVTNLITGCYDISTMDLRVNQLPNPTAPILPVTICDLDQDGFSVFNLTALTPSIYTTGTLTFYETETDAKNQVNPIPTPNAYLNIVAFNQTIYATAKDLTTGCIRVIPIALRVGPAPKAPTLGLLHDLKECDDHDGIINGFTNFDLTEGGVATSNANVLLATQSQPASSYNITYHTSLVDAQTTGSPQIILTTSYINAVVNTQTIWIAIEDKVTKCRNWGSFQLIVNKPLTLTTPAPYRLCDDDTNVPPRAPFDLTKQDPTILGTFFGTAGYTVTYYDTYAHALLAGSLGIITNPTAYVNVPDTSANNAQTLGVVVRTPDGCKSYTSLTIIVIPIPKPRALVLPNMILTKCDDINSPNNTELFNLTTNEVHIRNADPALMFEYYPTAADAAAGTNMYTTPTSQEVGTGNVWIKVMNTQLNWQGKRCYELVQQPIVVNPLPAISNQSFPICIPQAVAPAVTVMTGHRFDLTLMNPLVLDPTITTTIPAATTPQAIANYTFAYSTAGGVAIASPSTFTNTSNPQFITVTVKNTLTGCSTTAIVKLIVELEASSLTPVASISPLKSCDNDAINDGKFTFNLLAAGGIQEQILGAVPVAPYTNYAVAYFYEQPYLSTSPPIATNQVPATGLYVNKFPDSDFLWVVVTNTTTTTPCRLIFKIPVTVERYAKPVITSIDGNYTLCVDKLTQLPLNTIILDSGLLLPPLPTSPAPHPSTVASNYTFEWYLDGTLIPAAVANGPRFSITKEGDYEVKAISKSAAPLGCQSNKSAKITIKKSGPAVIGNPQFFVTNAFASNQVVTVNFQGGYGNYVYSLDNGPDQVSNVFENVPISIGATSHVIEVRDINGCAPITISNVETVDFPHFFTPNGDGVNDTWNISGLANQPKAIVYIYDRFGRLIKQISTSDTSNGWDGTFTGQQLPAADYWFTIDFMEETSNRIFKSHFSLKR